MSDTAQKKNFCNYWQFYCVSGFNVNCDDKRGLTFHLACREAHTGQLVMETKSKNAAVSLLIYRVRWAYPETAIGHLILKSPNILMLSTKKEQYLNLNLPHTAPFIGYFLSVILFYSGRLVMNFIWNNCLFIMNFGMMIRRNLNFDIIRYSVIFADTNRIWDYVIVY